MDNFIGYLTLKTKIDNRDFKAQIEKTRYELERLKEEEEAIRSANPYPNQEEDLRNLNAEISKYTNKLATLEKQQAKVEKSGLANIKKNIEDSEKSLGKFIKKAGKMVLAVFGIRSAFMAVRNAINVISSNDEQLKADIDYMKNALAYTLEPIVRKIVEWAKLLMFYVGYIVKAWTGKNIWENANKSLQKTNKEAKKLQKTLAGFDEVNVLNEQEDTGGGGATTPSFDLTKGIEDAKVPSWLQWIADHKNDIIYVIEAVGVGLLAWKVGMNAIASTGFALMLLSIVELVKSIIDYINDPSWSNFGNILIWIGGLVASLGLTFLGWPVAVAGAIIVVLGLLAKFWDKIEAWLDNLIEGLAKFGDDATNWLIDKLGIFGALIGAFILTITDALKHVVYIIKDVFGGIFKFVKTFIDGIIQIFKGDLLGGLGTILKGIANLFIDTFNILIDLLNLITTPVRSLIVALGKVAGKSWTMDTIQIPRVKRLATGGIVDIPKTGARLGNAIVGEKGAEGVLPLTDEATMTKLGQEIAKWIPINLNITNELDGRILSNRLEQIKQNNSFSRNGG